MVLPGRFPWEKPARSGEVLPGASAPWPLQGALTLALPRWEDGVAAQVLLFLSGLVAGAVDSVFQTRYQSAERFTLKHIHICPLMQKSQVAEVLSVLCFKLKKKQNPKAL